MLIDIGNWDYNWRVFLEFRISLNLPQRHKDTKKAQKIRKYVVIAPFLLFFVS